MNGIMQVIDDLDIRLHHRAQMEISGLQTIIKLARECNITVIDTQLDLFQQMLEEDQKSLEDRMQKVNSCDITNVNEVYRTLRATFQDSTKAEAYFLSILQHLLLIRQPERVHLLQVLDSIVSDVVMDKKLKGAEKRLGLTVERMVGQLEQAERAKEVEEELMKTRTAALHLKIEKEALEDRVAHADGLVATLQSEVLKLRLECTKLAGSGAHATAGISPTNTSYADRLAQLADVLPGSPLALSYVPTSTPRPTPKSNSAHTVNAKSSALGRQGFWGISSWFGSREDESGPGSGSPLSASTGARTNPISPLAMSLPSKTGLGISEMKEELIVTTNVGEKV